MIKNIIFGVIVGLMIIFTITTKINYGDYGFDTLLVYEVYNPTFVGKYSLFVEKDFYAIYKGENRYPTAIYGKRATEMLIK